MFTLGCLQPCHPSPLMISHFATCWFPQVLPSRIVKLPMAYDDRWTRAAIEK